MPLVSGDVRSARVVLTLESAQYMAGMKAAGATTQAEMGKASRATAAAGTSLTGLDKGSRDAREGLNTLGSTAGKVGLLAAGGIAVAVKSAADFDEAMSKVNAATHETPRNMRLLRESALEWGSKTKYSATEAAAGIEELAKAGVSTKDILRGGLGGALNLAAAGNLDVAEAAEIAASAMTQFRLSGNKVPKIADLLAAGAGKAQGSVRDLGQALNQSGLVAAQAGLSIEDTVGALSMFASAGMTGSDAGTSFKTMLMALTPNSKRAADLMKDLGIQAYDAQGNFVGLEEYAGRLRGGLKDLSEEQRNAALKTIFGADAVRAASILYRNGAKGVEEWRTKVDDAGYAADTARRQTDNLKGDVEKLGGALSTAFIEAGDGSQGPLRGLIQDATKLVDAYNDLGDGAKSNINKAVAATALLGGSAWAFTKVVNGIANTREALGQVGGLFRRAGNDARTSSGGIRGFAADLRTMATTSATAGARTERELSRSADAAARVRGSLGRVAKVGGGLALAAGGIAAIASASGRADSKMQLFASTAAGAATGFAVGGPWGAAIGGAVGLLGGFATSNADAARQVEGLTDSLNRQTGAVTDSTRALVVRRLESDGVLKTAQQLGLSIETVTQAAMGDRRAAAQLSEGYRAVSNAAKGAQVNTYGLANSPGLEKKAREYKGLMNAVTGSSGAIAEARQKHARMKAAMDAVSESTQRNIRSTQTYKSAIAKLPPQIRTRFEQPGMLMSQAQIRALGRQYNLTPKQVRTLIRQHGAEEASGKTRRLTADLRNVPKSVQSKLIALDGPANAAIAGVRGNLNALDGDKATVTIRTVRETVNKVTRQFSNMLPGFGSEGTTVPKTGLPYADRHLYMLADGEEVVSNRYGQADRWRPLLKAISANQLADGGTVNRSDVVRQLQSAPAGSPSVSVGGPRVAVYIDGQQVRALVREEAGAVYSAQNAAQRRWDDVD